MKQFSSKDTRRFNYILGETGAVYHGFAVKLGQSDSIMSILYTLCDVGDGCPISTICFNSGLSKQTVNSSLRKLENEGYITLKRLNGKSKAVYFTESGKELAVKTAAKILSAENSVFASWKKEEVELFLNLNEKFLRDIKKYDAFI